MLSLALIACSPAGEREAPATLTVFNAGSLARPLRAVLDSFARAEQVTIHQENAGSLESARKITELGNVPDVIALADEEVFPQFLVPAHASWYASFARNRMVIAYTPRSRFADSITADNWFDLLARPGVEVGRSDPNLDPNGYRTLLALDLAERHYGRPGLAARALAAIPARNVRPKEADLVGLLQVGELDYIWSYESIARALGLRYLRLPPTVDLGEPGDSLRYARVSVRVAGARRGDSVTFRGRPIVYALTIPSRAPNPALAERFVAFLFSPAGVRILRAAQLDALDRPVLVGAGAPAAVAAAAGR